MSYCRSLSPMICPMICSAWHDSTPNNLDFLIFIYRFSWVLQNIIISYFSSLYLIFFKLSLTWDGSLVQNFEYVLIFYNSIKKILRQFIRANWALNIVLYKIDHSDSLFENRWRHTVFFSEILIDASLTGHY